MTHEEDTVSEFNDDRDYPAEAEAREEQGRKEHLAEIYHEFKASHLIVSEFNHNGAQFVFYRLNDINPSLYITGDPLDWQLGWKYDENMGHFVQVSYVSDDLRVKIVRALHEMRNRPV